MLTSIFSSIESGLDIIVLLITSLVAILLGFVIALTHKFTSKYSKSFLVTLTVLPLLVEAVIIMVNGNLGTSIAILGAFSLVRFRSVPGTSKEILSVFFSMTIGLALGMGHVLFASIITGIACFVIALFSLTKIFDIPDGERILKVVVPEDMDYTDMFDAEFLKYTKKHKLEKVKTTNMGSLFELTYVITLKKKINVKEFMDDIRIKNNNLKVIITHQIENVEI